MRILLCCGTDLMSNLALNHLWPSLDGHVFDIVLSWSPAERAGKAPEIGDWEKAERAFMENTLFPRLEQGSRGGFKSFSQMARLGHGGATRSFPTINRGEGLDHVRRFDPDVVVSIRFRQIFKAPVIGIPRLGIINLHSGLLPAYRGILATFWSMLRGEDAIGCTLHYVDDDTIDTGPIIGTYERATDKGASVAANVASLYEGGVAMIAATLDDLAGGREVERRVPDGGKGAYFSYPTGADVAAFLAGGGTLYSDADHDRLSTVYGVADG